MRVKTEKEKRTTSIHISLLKSFTLVGATGVIDGQKNRIIGQK